MKIVWITGSHGFVGTNLIEQAPADWDIYKISSTYTEEPKSMVYNPMMMSPFSKLPLPDIVIHLGAVSDPRQAELCIPKNTQLTHMMLEYLARQQSKCSFVFASSINVYGPGLNRTIDETAYTEPTTAYATSKSMCDELLKAYDYMTEIKPVSLRFSGIVGKYMTHGIVKDVVKKLSENPKELKLWGNDPGTSKTYIHVNEACQAIIDASKAKKGAPIIRNICYSTSWLTAKSAATIIAEEMGLRPEIKWTGNTYKGDYSVPKMLHKHAYFHPQYFTMALAFAAGVRDYIHG